MSAFSFHTHSFPFHKIMRTAKKRISISDICGRTDNTTKQVLKRVHLALLNKIFHVPQAYGSKKEWGPVIVVANPADLPPTANPVTRKFVTCRLIHGDAPLRWKYIFCPNCQRHTSKQNGYPMFQKPQADQSFLPVQVSEIVQNRSYVDARFLTQNDFRNSLLNSETNSLNTLYVYTWVRGWFHTAAYIYVHIRTDIVFPITVFTKKVNAKYNGDNRGFYSGSLVSQSGWRIHPYSRFWFVNVTIHPIHFTPVTWIQF
jgi:hypothetical protein